MQFGPNAGFGPVREEDPGQPSTGKGLDAGSNDSRQASSRGMISMTDYLQAVFAMLGPGEERYAGPAAWLGLEEELGRTFPGDCKQIVDAYAPVQINGHLTLRQAGGTWARRSARRQTSGLIADGSPVTFLHARLDEEADLTRRCDGDGCGAWTAHGHTVDFCQGELSGFHSTIAVHVATTARPGHALTCSISRRPTPITLTAPNTPETEIVYGTAIRRATEWGALDGLGSRLSGRTPARTAHPQRIHRSREQAAGPSSEPDHRRRARHSSGQAIGPERIEGRPTSPYSSGTA
ncbi:hypothetical protein GA0115255_101102 [Streptomyces sp. Ncost-T6T-2b]|nr:hypothetical protein GA0115255_101102 [Streptomyces sp. Ncost-T6T-2b]